jgi:hypothetical protein
MVASPISSKRYTDIWRLAEERLCFGGAQGSKSASATSTPPVVSTCYQNP